MSQLANNLEVQNLNHLGIIAGIIDEIGIVDIINEQLGIQPRVIAYNFSSPYNTRLLTIGL
jgi:hypothetical protein